MAASQAEVPPNPSFEVVHCRWEDTDIRDQCKDIRIEVFCVEQGYDPELETDELDEGSDHFLLVDVSNPSERKPVGTIRLYAPKMKLGRLAVIRSYRRFGCGRKLVEGLENAVRNGTGGCKAAIAGKEFVTIQLGAQLPARKFYEKLGYTVPEGEDIYLDEGEEHINMTRRIDL